MQVAVPRTKRASISLTPVAALPDAARLQAMDDPLEWPSFGQSVRPGVWDSTVVIEGMHCAGCARNVERALTSVPGVSAALVSAASGRARVTWSAEQALPSRWMAAVQAGGYRIFPALNEAARSARQHQERMSLWRWLVAALCMMQVMMYAVPAYLAEPGELTPDMAQLLRWASWVLTLPVVFFSSGPFFTNAWRDVRERRISMDLPVALGLGITFLLSSAVTFAPGGVLGSETYFDALTMFVFFLLTARWLEARLRGRTAGALEALMLRVPESVERQIEGGGFERINVRRLMPGDVIRVLAGQAFPADAVVLDGRTQVDEALLTGESRPLGRTVGARVIAGSHNLSAPLLVRVEKVGAQTRFAQIVALMETAATQKPRIAQLADRVAGPFLIGVLVSAVGAALWWWPTSPAQALMVSVAVLVVTCPCALSLATPAALLASAGALARRGVLVRNLQGLEALAKVDTVVFDKTGTLTQDGLGLRSIRTREGFDGGTALHWAALLAQRSLHPASRALALAFAEQGGESGASRLWRIDAVQEHAGQGLSGRLLGEPSRLQGEPVRLQDQSDRPLAEPAQQLRLGSASFCAAPASAVPPSGPQVHLADVHGWLASFELSEQIRPDAAAAVTALRKMGVAVRLLSGDSQAAVTRVAQVLGIDEAQGECSPDDKLAALLAAQQRGEHIAMVGDGLNDAPVLAAATTSFAFAKAVPLARARADFVVLGDQLCAVVDTLTLARRTRSVVRQNLIWAAAYNAVCVPLAVVGWLPAWAAGLGMASSSLLVVMNAARLSRQTGVSDAPTKPSIPPIAASVQPIAS